MSVSLVLLFFTVSTFASQTDHLPKLTKTKELKPSVKPILEKIAKRQGMTPEHVGIWTDHVSNYLSFLGLTPRDLKREPDPIVDLDTTRDVTQRSALPPPDSTAGNDEPVVDEDQSANKVGTFMRLRASILQFLACDDLSDWRCLENTPELQPTVKYRIDTAPDLGKPVFAGEKLEMDLFYTDQWDRDPVQKDLKTTVANQLGALFQDPSVTQAALAIFGIDSLDTSLAPVYQGIQRLFSKNPQGVRAVFDIMGLQPTSSRWIMSYSAPTGMPEGPWANAWLFEERVNPHRILFQYDGSLRLLQDLNANISNEMESRARVEWPDTGIMHNKFVVFEKADQSRSVWTGTANISDTCMGSERNANVSAHIKNTPIANAFLTEFEEMFQFDPNLALKNPKVTDAVGGPPPIGRFHKSKRPNTPRLFEFGDGTEVRLFFSPTDDGEHRALIPLLLSAQSGDLIRISMFGGAGYELVRAMQYAAAKGAHIHLVFDKMLAASPYSWVNAFSANLLERNPYFRKVIRRAGSKPGNIQVRTNTWMGKNHHKSATLTRFDPHSNTMKAEVMVIGSQNWSAGGNDSNDENMLLIRRRGLELPAIAEFNQYFDTRLWKNSRPWKSKR